MCDKFIFVKQFSFNGTMSGQSSLTLHCDEIPTSHCGRLTGGLCNDGAGEWAGWGGGGHTPFSGNRKPVIESPATEE